MVDAGGLETLDRQSVGFSIVRLNPARLARYGDDRVVSCGVLISRSDVTVTLTVNTAGHRRERVWSVGGTLRGRWSVMITKHLVFNQWGGDLQEPDGTVAAIDQFVHHEVILGFVRSLRPI